MIYPVAIVLIVLGLFHKHLHTWTFPCTVGAVSVVSVLFALENLNVPLGMASTLLHKLPFYAVGMGWVSVAVAALMVSCVAGKLVGSRQTADPVEESAL